MPHDQPIRAAAGRRKVTFLETNSRAGQKWAPVTLPATAPSNEDGIDFVLTPRERDHVALAKLAIIDHKRRQNRLDDAQALGVALETFE